MEKFEKRVTVNLTLEEFKKLSMEAAYANCSVSKCARDSLLENWALKKELANSFEGLRAEVGAERVIHSVISRSEEIICRSIDRQTEEVSQVGEKVEQLQARFERFIRKSLG